MYQHFKRRLLAFFLAVCALLGTSMFASATSIRNDSRFCTITNYQMGDYLTAKDGTLLTSSGFTYTTDDGLTGPAYCINQGLGWRHDAMPVAGKYAASPEAAGVFASGYPQVSLQKFLENHLAANAILAGLTEDEYWYATQASVWAALGQIGVDGTQFTSGRFVLPYPSGGTIQEMRVFRAIQILLNIAATWDRIYETSMYIRLSDSVLGGNQAIPPDMTLEYAAENEQYGIKREVINGVSYFTKEYVFASATSPSWNDFTLELWAENAPEGTIFADLENRELPHSTWSGIATWRVPVKRRDTTLNGNGFEYYGKAKLCIPVSTAPNKGEITVWCAANVEQYSFFLVESGTASKQDFMIADPARGQEEAKAVLSWGSDMTEQAYLHITKVGGGGSGLPGAVFTLTGSDGSSRTGTTSETGEIFWNNLRPGVLYTLTEDVPPAGYGVVDPIKLTLRAARVEYVTVKDDPQHTLTVHKQDQQTGYSLRGAVIRFEQIDGSFKTTATTDHAGNIQFNADRLPIGSYRVYEVTAPEGYELDSTAQTVHWDGKRDVTLTFTNVRQKTLVISKKDSRTGRGLADATFEVYRNGQLVSTVISNDVGLAYVPGIINGYYEVKEIIAPTGYTLNSKTYGINIDPYDPGTTDDPRLVIENEPLPGLRIVKYDRESGKPLADTTFKVYHDTVLLGTYITDRYGEIHLTGLEPGTYTVEEVAAPDTHTVNSTPQSIELVAGQKDDATLVFFNPLKPGIHLVKVDSETLKPLPNATYLISKVGGSFAKEYVTDVNGEIELSKLEPGAYQVQEVKAPDGYLIDDGIRTIQINADENAQFVFTDTPKPSLSVVKYDPNTGKYLAGATFRITKVEDGSHYLDRVTDTTGRITITGLEPGVYSVQETAAPAGYVLNPTEYHVELFPGKESELVVINDAKPDLRIVKTDAITGKPVEGVTFTVKMADGQTITTEATNGDGEILLTGMEPGVVEIWERSVPNAYLLNTEHQFITLVPNKEGTVHFENYPKSGLVVHKVDGVTGDPIKGAKFHITYASNSTFTGEINDLGHYITDDEGRIHLTGLKDGWYKITETEPAPGYTMRAPSSQDVYVKAGAYMDVTFENIPLSALVIYKYDNVTGAAVEGAVFQVKYLSGLSGTGGTVIGTHKTSSNGTFTVTGLKAGTYIVEELASDSDHVIDTAPQTAYISGKTQDVVQLYFGNSPKGSLTVTKLDSATRKPISGVEFLVVLADGSFVGSNNGKFITDSAGTFTIDGLNPGSSLVVKETRAKTGYLLDDTVQTTTIKAGQAVSLEFLNTPIPEGNLRIVKLDERSRQPLQGVEFTVSHIDGLRVGTYRTNSKGIINLTDITPGWYTVVETKALAGYMLDAEPRDIEVKNGQTAMLEVTNRQSGSALIHKIDSVTGKGIYGVTFLVCDAKGNPVGVYTSDDQGYVYVDKELNDGKYTIREIQQAEGYVLDTTPKTVYVEYGGTTTITWKNTPITGQIQITKTSADYNTINGWPAGTPIPGTEFEVYSRAGVLVDTIRTDKNGLAISKPLPLGRYKLVESKAADNYLLDKSPIEVELEYEGQIVRTAMTNKIVCTGVSITKTGYAEVMPGQAMRYTLKDIANISNVPLDNFYWRDALPVNSVRLEQIITGTYNAQGSYKVVYRTNLSGGDYRTLADNLSTQRNYTINASPAVLRLASNEYVTEVMAVFGVVPAGFRQVEQTKIDCSVLPGLSNGVQIINQADVGGTHNGVWVQAISRWVTKVYAPVKRLPQMGY